MRSKAFSFLLSLSLMFCVGFGSSLTASAAEVSPDAQNEWFLLPFNEYGSFDGSFNYDTGTYFINDSSTAASGSRIFTVSNTGAVLPKFEYGHKYLIYSTLSLLADTDLYRIFFRQDASTIQSEFRLYPISSYKTYVNSTSTLTHFYEFTPTQDYILSTGSFIYYEFLSPVASTGRVSWAFYALDITDSSEDEVNQIIAAINDQTSDIQQSIEDQYGGDPGSSFPVEDIITQHNEKMGVLSFSSDALMQVLGLLSPDQTLSSELVFPSMSLTIAGQRNKVQLWPEYRFDLNTLKQHWPDFVELMQSLTTALVWIFVLRYCYRVFEKYFLAGGGN